MKSVRRLALPLALLSLLTLRPLAVEAADGWLVATGSDSVRAGAPIDVEVIRPATATWPPTLSLRLSPAVGDARVLVLDAATDGGDGLRRTYRLVLPAEADGLLRAELADRPSNRIALVVERGPGASADALARMTAPPPAGNGVRHLDPVPDDEPALSANEAMYFVAGARDGLDARFQLSFKYRLFDPHSAPVRFFAPLGQLYLGYTQTSLWDLNRDSKPFRDTSYRPSLFWQGRIGTTDGLLPTYLRGGYEHESNGRDGEKSRSIDMLFVQPAWRRDFADGRTLLFAPRLHAYLERDDNPDIARYRGYADWIVRYGDEGGWVASARLRRGTSGRGSGQLDLSVPLRDPLFARVGGFLHFQVFSGYGETLLDYNVKRPPQFRVGFSIVR